jgi:hypothetical protein
MGCLAILEGQRQQTCVPRTPDARLAIRSSGSFVNGQRLMGTALRRRPPIDVEMLFCSGLGSVSKEVCRHTNANGERQTPS